MQKIIPVPAVNIAVMNDKNECLLTRRSSKVREPGKWCLPGGHIEMGESWLVSAKRELIEEVGIPAQTLVLSGIYSDPGLTVTPEVLKEGHRAQFVVAVFLMRGFTGDVKPNDEVDQWQWFKRGDLPEPILKSHPIRVQDAFEFDGEVFVR